MRRVVLAVALLGGCGDDSGGAGDTGTATDNGTAPDSAGTAAECIPGEERCECNDGQCLSGLVCASNVCVNLPEDPSGDASESAEGGSESGGGPTTCDTTANCPSNAICFANGECGDPWDADSFLLSIPSADVCPVDGAGGAEVYYDVKIDDAVVFSSAVAGCPPGWGNEEYELTDFVGAFSIEFWESDAFFDDFITSLCWDTLGAGECGPVPRQFLHDGQWSGSFGAEDAYTAEIVFNFVQ